jgi:hypothetical protein
LVAAVELVGEGILVAAADQGGGLAGAAAVVGVALANVAAHVGLGEGRAAGQGEQGDSAGNQSLVHVPIPHQVTPKSDEEILPAGFPEKLKKSVRSNTSW